MSHSHMQQTGADQKIGGGGGGAVGECGECGLDQKEDGWMVMAAFPRVSCSLLVKFLSCHRVLLTSCLWALMPLMCSAFPP